MTAPDSSYDLTLRTVAMPADANPDSHIFGGWVMWQMDLAAYLCASELAGGRTVTASVRQMAFEKPVQIGDTVCLYTKFVRFGRSSVDVEVQVWTRRASSPVMERVTVGLFVMVAVDTEGKSIPAFAGHARAA